MSPITRNTGPAPRTLSEARRSAEYGTAGVRCRAPLLTRFLHFLFWSPR
jgi:hypothetical protein